MKKIEHIFIPCRMYRETIEQELDACFSLEEAQDLVVENASELYSNVSKEEMREIINEGPKSNVFSFNPSPEEGLLYYPDGNGNWPVQIKKVKLRTPLYLK